MKTFISGIALGALVATLVVGAYALGTSAKAQQGPGSHLAPNCQVSVGYGQLTGGTQCNFNTVLVGTESNYLLCADLTVTCD